MVEFPLQTGIFPTIFFCVYKLDYATLSDYSITNKLSKF